MSAKNLFARSTDIKSIKNDSEFIQYVTEMFTWNEDDEEITHPENIKFVNNHNRVELHIFNFFCNSDNQWFNIGYVYKCNCCGEYSIEVHDKPDPERYCYGCKEEFNQIGDMKNIEW